MQEPGKLHVLVVDDDEARLALTQDWLRSAGHRVTTRTSTVGTAADVIALRPDVVLLEVIMPGLRGDDLARLFKRHSATRGVAVILCSSIPIQELRTMIMTAGVLGVIEKSANQALFLYTFHSVTAKLRAAARVHDVEVPSVAPATSGTFPIESRISKNEPEKAERERTASLGTKRR